MQLASNPKCINVLLFTDRCRKSKYYSISDAISYNIYSTVTDSGEFQYTILYTYVSISTYVYTEMKWTVLENREGKCMVVSTV